MSFSKMITIPPPPVVSLTTVATSMPEPPTQNVTPIDPTVIRSIIEQAYHVPTDEKGRIIPSRRQIGYELFINRFERCVLVDAFLAVIEQLPLIAAECPKYNNWRAPKCQHLVHLIAQAFMSAMTSERTVKKTKKEKVKITKESGKDRQAYSFPKVQLNITDEQRRRILHALVPLNFNHDSGFWNMIDYALNFNKCLTDVLTIILDAAEKGQASFTAVDYCIRNKMLSRYIDDPTILSKAALLGPLQANAVESFAARRSCEFRKKCREELLRMEKLASNKRLWTQAVVEYFGSFKQIDPDGKVVAFIFSAFHASVHTLMKDLRGMPPSDDRINIGWAYHVVKKCAARYYLDKTWKIENLNEVLWTVLAQRPFMRKFVVETLSKGFQDPESAETWRTCVIPPEARRNVRKISEEEHLDPRTPNPPFLSLPESVEPVEFVMKAAQLNRVKNILQEYANDGYPPVGVDAEWSSYVSYSKATILQIAIPSHVFIIDIDTIKKEVLVEFFEKFFVEWKLLKIGYQFGEDLIQLRNAVHDCQALYHPKNLICIGVVVQTLMSESMKRPEVCLDGVFYPEEVQVNEEEEEEEETAAETDMHMDVDENGCAAECDSSLEGELSVASDALSPSQSKCDVAVATSTDEAEETIVDMKQNNASTSNQENQQPVECNPLSQEIRGLSALCARVLGKPLDKTEQCSVWDRRPLRDLQLRYAALDAYCMLMLYEKCAEWATRLDLNLNEICSKQEPPLGALPLFFDEK